MLFYELISDNLQIDLHTEEGKRFELAAMDMFL